MQDEPTSPDALLALAAERLRMAAAGYDPAEHAAYAIRLVMAAGEDPRIFSASAARVADVGFAFDASVGAVVLDAAGPIDAAIVSYGMGVARSLLQFFGRSPEDLAGERYRSNEILDCFDRAAVMAAELEAMTRRRRIRARREALRPIAMEHGSFGHPASASVH